LPWNLNAIMVMSSDWGTSSENNRTSSIKPATTSSTSISF
jgi:hypothetical protein